MTDNKKSHSNQKPRRESNGRGFSFVGNNQQKMSVHFGSAIKTRRQQLGMTQTELAKLANINRSYLSELEQGKVGISLGRAEKLAKTLNCELRDLL